MCDCVVSIVKSQRNTKNYHWNRLTDFHDFSQYQYKWCKNMYIHDSLQINFLPKSNIKWNRVFASEIPFPPHLNSFVIMVMLHLSCMLIYWNGIAFVHLKVLQFVWKVFFFFFFFF